jgi:DNA-binding response OmpR family regulator
MLTTRAVDEARAGHVLIVDDNTVNRMLVGRALQEHGHFVETADDGEAGLRLLRTRRPLFDVVLLDIMMPVMDGFETLRRMKADEDLRETPVIMISSVEETDAVIRCLRLGASDYIPKPFNAMLQRALTNRVDAHLAAKRAQRRERELLRLLDELADVTAGTEVGKTAPARLRQLGVRQDEAGKLARAILRLTHGSAARPVSVG